MPRIALIAAAAAIAALAVPSAASADPIADALAAVNTNNDQQQVGGSSSTTDQKLRDQLARDLLAKLGGMLTGGTTTNNQQQVVVGSGQVSDPKVLEQLARDLLAKQKSTPVGGITPASGGIGGSAAFDPKKQAELLKQQGGTIGQTSAPVAPAAPTVSSTEALLNLLKQAWFGSSVRP